MLDENATRHAVKALRLKVYDDLILFDGSGNDYNATITSCSKQICEVKITGIAEQEQASKLEIHLAIGISRGERMDFSIQKAVELGVQSITPLFTERCMVQLKGKRLESRLEHWKSILLHACEQSGRSLIPQIRAANSLSAWLENFQGNGLLLDHRSENSLETITPVNDITLLVGPEGGLSEQERQQAAGQGMQGIRLGPRVLRTETAPLAALAAIQMLWGDFR